MVVGHGSREAMIGRAAEVALVGEAFEHRPIVTLTGLPGIGTTTVARAFASRHEHAWIRSGEPVDGELPGLVVIDGVDPADAAEADRIELLGRVGVSVLVTAVAPLRLAEERVVRVGAFPVVDAARPATKVRDELAVQLFMSVAAASGFATGWTDDEVRAIADVVSAVGGHPMAIELLAARNAVLSPAAMRAQLIESGELSLTWINDSDRILDAMSRATRPVSDRGRVVLSVMAVFAGPVPIDAIATNTGLDAADLVDVLAELVDFHLVDVDSGDHTVFMLPPLVGAAERRRWSNEPSPAAARVELHLAWATGVASRSAHGARGELGVPEALIGVVESDLVAAFRRGLAAGDVDSSTALAIALAPTWLAVGVLGWQLDLVQAAARLAESTCDRSAAAIVRGWAATLLAERAVQPADVERVVAERDAALAMAVGCDDLTVMRVLALAVRAGRAVDDQASVIELALEGLECARRLEDPGSEGRFEVWLGMLAHQTGTLDDAIEWGNRAWRRARQTGDEAAMISAVGFLRTLPRDAIDEPMPSLAEISAGARRCGDLRTLTWVLPAAANEAIGDGDLESGLAMTIESLEIAGRAGTWVWYLVPPLLNLARIAELTGRVATASWVYGIVDEQMSVFRSSMPPKMVGLTERAIARARNDDDHDLAWSFASGRLATFGTAVDGALDAARELSTAKRESALPTPDPLLTPRELEVLRELAKGGTNKDIASELGIRPKTVMHHAAAIYRKLNVDGRGAAVARWFNEPQLHSDRRPAEGTPAS